MYLLSSFIVINVHSRVDLWICYYSILKCFNLIADWYWQRFVVEVDACLSLSLALEWHEARYSYCWLITVVSNPTRLRYNYRLYILTLLDTTASHITKNDGTLAVWFAHTHHLFTVFKPDYYYTICKTNRLIQKQCKWRK